MNVLVVKSLGTSMRVDKIPKRRNAESNDVHIHRFQWHFKKYQITSQKMSLLSPPGISEGLCSYDFTFPLLFCCLNLNIQEVWAYSPIINHFNTSFCELLIFTGDYHSLVDLKVFFKTKDIIYLSYMLQISFPVGTKMLCITKLFQKQKKL